MKYIVACGNPFDGLVCYGPFDQHEDASRWAEDEVDNIPDWWVVEVEPVKDSEDE